MALRILYLSPWFPYPLDTGSRVRVYHLVLALAQHHRVTLLTLEPQDWAPAETGPIGPLCERVEIVHHDPFRRSGMSTALRFFSPGPIVARPFAAMSRLAECLHLQSPFDIAIAGTVVMSPYVRDLCGVVRVLEEHNSHTRWMHDRYQTAQTPLHRLRCWASWKKSARFESRLFRWFDLVTMVSEPDAATARSLTANGQPPVEVFPNGVDCETFRPGLVESQPDTLVFGGSLTYVPNYEGVRFFLERIYPLIRKQCPGVRLRITGSVEGVNLDVLPLNESVTVTGFVEDVRTEVAGAAVAVVPLRSGGGTRLKVLEAMALGTPVVSTSKGVEGLDVVPDRDLFVADDPAAFAQATVRLLGDPPLRARICRSARNLVERQYDWAQIGGAFAERVARLVQERGT